MRILYASHARRDPLKGAPWADIALLEALRQRGHEVEEIWDFASPRNIRHDNLHLLLEAPGRCERAVLSRLATGAFDVVLVNQPLGWKAGQALRRRSPAPLYVARSHGWEPRVYQELAAANTGGGGNARGPLRRLASGLLRPLLHRQNEKVLEVADGVVVGSAGDRAWMSDEYGFPEERILAMPPGIAREFLASPAVPMGPERLRRLLYVGQFAPFKAPGVVAEAMAGVLTAVPEASATWVCASAHHESVRRLFPEGLRGRLKLLDWMPRDALVRTYDEGGVFIFPSYAEGFGQTFLEAMARGMVVLATRVGGMRETLRDGENGFLFEPGAGALIAQQALWLVANPGGAAEIAGKARRTAEGFTWEASAQRFEDFIAELQSGLPLREVTGLPGAASGGPSVSIAIPTFGRESILLDTLRHLLSLPDRADEILVLDQTPAHEPETDRQMEEWNSTGVVRWVRLSKPSIPGSMNEGLRQAHSDVVLFLDDDLVPLPGLVKAHREAHRTEGVGAVTGMVLQPGQHVRLRTRGFRRGRGLRRDLEFPFNATGSCSVSTVMAGNLSVKREAALAAGGFDERFTAVAYRFETEFCRRMRRTGADVRYEPRAVIHHLKAESGGTRTWGQHQKSIRPEHSVGDYYFALREGRGFERWAYVASRLRRECLSAFHLSHPWWIPVKLLGELRGLYLAVSLFRKQEVGG